MTIASFIGKKTWIWAECSSPKLGQLRNTTLQWQHFVSWLLFAFKFNILRNFTIKCFSFSYTLLKENKSLKEWVNSVGINPFMKYNIPVGFSFDNNILIITEKFTLIFWKTCRAISNQQKRAYQRALRALHY